MLKNEMFSKSLLNNTKIKKKLLERQGAQLLELSSAVKNVANKTLESENVFKMCTAGLNAC